MHPRMHMSIVAVPWHQCQCGGTTYNHTYSKSTLRNILSKFELNLTNGFQDTAIFVSSPCFANLTIIWPSRSRNMASEPNPQQLITQSAQATANAIASTLMARTTSISLPIYNWDSKDAYHSSPYFGIPWRTGSSLTASCLTVRTTSDTSLQPWEQNAWRCMYNGCLLAAKRNREQQRQKLLPSLTEYTREWHMTSTPMCALENSRMLWPGWERTPKISLQASRHWWATARWSMMITASTSCITASSMHTAMRESSLGKIWQNHSRHLLVSYLTSLWTTMPFSMPENKFPTAPNLWTQLAMTSIKQPTPVTMVMVTHHLHPPSTAPIAHDNTQPAEQTAPHGIPIAPNVTRLDTGDWNATVASHLNQEMHLCQGMHPQLGHSMGSPDAHLEATTTALAGVVNRCHRCR